MINISKINEVTHPKVRHARIRLNDGWDIIRVTYTDDGFIQIYSSYGHYAYHWTAMGEGVTLQGFFSDRDSNDYLANKLWNHSNDQKYFDYDKAVEEILERAKENLYLDDEELEEFKNDIDYKIGETESRDLFFERWMSDKELNEFIPEIYFEDFGMEYTGRYLALLNDVIPTIQKYFRGELDEQ